MTNEQTESAKNSIEKVILKVQRTKVIESKTIEVDGRNISYFDFISSAVDSDIYNFMFFFFLKETMLMGCFNCLEPDRQDWKEIFLQMILTGTVLKAEGDTVQVLFPNEDENEGYSKLSIPQKDSDKTTDPLVKYLRTPFGKEVKLEKEEILITAKYGTTFIKINETSGIDIITDKAVQVNAGESISVTAGDTISMKSTNDFTINSGKNLNISVADSITMTCRENSVKLETPASGIELDAKSKGKFTVTSSYAFQLTADKKLGATSKETIELICKDNSVKLESGGSGILLDSGKAIKVTGKDKVDITSKSDMTASSSKNLNVSASQKLVLFADSTIEAFSKGSFIKMDGDIDMKAKLIKEN